MNYRHAFHAGNFADILKHVVLSLCFEHLKKKPQAFRYIDSHSGIGIYDLTGDEAQRSPEWRDGIARLLAEKTIPKGPKGVLRVYLDAVKSLNKGAELTHYPGSPGLAAALMRDIDRAHLCELHEADAKTLDARFAKDARIKVEKRDGYKALPKILPPREKRGVVLVDPPFEHRDEMAHMAEAAIKAFEAWPTGTFIFWRPLKDLWAQERFDVGFAEWLIAEKQVLPEKVLRADLWVRDLESEGKLAGAGVFIVNPPYTLEEDLVKLLPWLSELLAQGEGAGWRVDGGFTEESLTTEEF